jgi:DNA-binding MarR family transcriptional regulator
LSEFSIRRLLETQLDTFEKLEVTIALYRAGEASRALSELGKALLLDRDGVKKVAMELVANGVAEFDGPDRLRLMATYQTAQLAELARVYDEDRVLVVTTLSSIAMSRIRGMAARTFSDAFTLRKTRNDEDG